MTGLRFFLALWVIFHHLTGPGMPLDKPARLLPHALYELIRGGYLAVTTFFVLSGFVLAHGYAATRWDVHAIWRYGAGRIARIYPVYLLSLAVMVPFIAADRSPAKGQLVLAHTVLVQGWLGPLPVNWNTPAWSLSCEMFFYIAFPLAVMLIPRSGWRGALGVAGVAVCLTRILWALGISDGIKPLIHLSDFLMGIAAASVYELLSNAHRPPAGAALSLAGAASGAALIAWPRLLPPGLDLNTALRPLNAVLLIGLALGGGMAARLLSTSAAVFLGKASYAMYILHVPLLWWYYRFSARFSASLYLVLVIAVSAIVYTALEEPANRWLRSRLSPRRSLQVALQP